jgi:hypothetical protein
MEVDVSDKPQANMMPAMYSHSIHTIQMIGRASGYALAIHGSMQRDLDIVAVPWTDKAVKPRKLVKRLCKQLDLMFDPKRNPTKKPHGRLVWSLLFSSGGSGFMDLSVMPPTPKPNGER